MKVMHNRQKQTAFTIVELILVIVVIAVITTISTVAYKGVQARSRDALRMAKLKDIQGAVELYKLDNGFYPPVDDGGSWESTCGSQTDNWGHCDRLKQLSDFLAPYKKFDLISLSDAIPGNLTNGFYYNSGVDTNYQTYGIYITLEGNGGQNDGGYFANAFEVGPDPIYCMKKYTGTAARWGWSGNAARCYGGS